MQDLKIIQGLFMSHPFFIIQKEVARCRFEFFRTSPCRKRHGHTVVLWDPVPLWVSIDNLWLDQEVADFILTHTLSVIRGWCQLQDQVSVFPHSGRKGIHKIIINQVMWFTKTRFISTVGWLWSNKTLCLCMLCQLEDWSNASKYILGAFIKIINYPSQSLKFPL